MVQRYEYLVTEVCVCVRAHARERVSMRESVCVGSSLTHFCHSSSLTQHFSHSSLSHTSLTLLSHTPHPCALSHTAYALLYLPGKEEKYSTVQKFIVCHLGYVYTTLLACFTFDYTDTHILLHRHAPARRLRALNLPFWGT